MRRWRPASPACGAARPARRQRSGASPVRIALQEQHRGGFSGLVGVLPDPGARSVRRAEGPRHGLRPGRARPRRAHRSGPVAHPRRPAATGRRRLPPIGEGGRGQSSASSVVPAQQGCCARPLLPCCIGGSRGRAPCWDRSWACCHHGTTSADRARRMALQPYRPCARIGGGGYSLGERENGNVQAGTD